MAIHYDMSFSEYINLPGWNWSKIKILRNQSPAHIQHAIRTEDDDTASRVWLRAVHCLVLERHNFDAQFTVYEGRRDKRTKAYQAFLDEAGNRSVLNANEHASALAAARHIVAHPEIAAHLEYGKPEATLTWIDRDTGLPCKCRIDWLAFDSSAKPYAIDDLKTLGTAHPREVGRMTAKNGYHGQLAHYAEGARANGLGELAVNLWSAEGKGAQDVGVFDMGAGITGSALHAGDRLRRRLMQQLAWCVERDEWPGAAAFSEWPESPRVVDMQMPQWAYDDIDGGE